VGYAYYHISLHNINDNGDFTKMNMTKRQLFAGILIVAVFSSLITYAYAQSFTTYLESGSMVVEPAYIIFVSGNYYARNGVTGKIDYSGSQASPVIQAVFNVVTEGSHIHFKIGDYNLYTKITINKTLKLTGESGRPPYGAYGTRFRLFDDDDAFYVTAEGVYFSDLWLDGRGSDTPVSGIYFDDPSKDFVVERVTVWGLNDGIGIKAAKWNGVLYACSFSNNKIGVQLLTSAVNTKMFGCVFHSNLADSILLDIQGGQQTQIYGTDFEGDQTKTTGIQINTSVSQIRLHGARFELLLNGVKWVSGKGSDDYMYGAIFTGTVTNIVVNAPSDCKIESCSFNFRTEEYGTANASNGDTIAFGVTLAGIPQSVLITVNENDARYIAQAYTITTTGFDLYLWDDTAGALETVDKTISWHVKYEP